MKARLITKTTGAGAVAAALMVMALPMGGVAAQTAPGQYGSYNFSGYSTGTAEHVGAIQAGLTGPQLANAEVAFSGASVASQGTGGVTQGPGAKAGTIVNEMSQVVQPTLPATGTAPKLAGDKSFARGSGLEVGLGNNLPNPSNQIPVDKVQVSAPPSATDFVTVGPVGASPLAYADLLKGQAAANFNPNACTLGTPLSQGLGYAANAQVLETGTSTPAGTLAQPVLAANGPSNTTQNVNQSLSQTLLVPQTQSDGKTVVGPNLGLRSETRQILAPVTFFKGTPNEFTIQLAGEWVLQAVAGGLPGSAYVHYGPGSVTPTTPVLTVIQNGVPNQIITTQQILGKTGLTIPIPSVANIVIGEGPRAIGSDSSATAVPPVAAADGTNASAAVDVVRVQLLQQKNATGGITFQGADVRIGHMESSAKVPAGGISCPIPVTKTAPDAVSGIAGSTITIHVANPYDCTLTSVHVTDNIKTLEGDATAQVTGTSPQADTQTNTLVDWKDVGPIAPGGGKDLVITYTPQGVGRLTDTVDVTANCGNGTAAGSNQINVPLTGTVKLDAPLITGRTAASVKSPAGTLPTTGGPSWPLEAGAGALVALLGVVGVRRRLFS